MSCSSRRTTRSFSNKFNISLQSGPSTRRQSRSSHTNRETRSSASRRQVAAERRSRRAQILRERRTSRNKSHPHANLVQQHFNRMRNRPQRLPSNNAVSGGDNSDSNNSSLGIMDFNSPSDSLPSTPYTFLYSDLNHEENYVCPHCCSMLWKEEKRHRLHCCNKGKYAIPSLKPVPPELMTTFRGNRFQRGQKAYNGLFSFTALGAGGIDKKSWTRPQKLTTEYLICNNSIET